MDVKAMQVMQMQVDPTILQAYAEAQQRTGFLWRMRFRWRRLKTNFRLLSPQVRAEWQQRFAEEPSLHSARCNLNQAPLAAYQTMAAYYNDHTPQGHMSMAMARRIFEGS